MSPLHMGTGRDSLESASQVVSSDMLSAALASVRAMKGKKEGIKEFLESFSISAAFPYYGEEYFLPSPVGKLNITVKGQKESEYRKQLKRIKYISSNLWHKLMRGETLEVESAQIHGEYLIEIPDEDFRTPTTHVVNQRVMVPREENLDAVPFMFEWTFFRHGEKEAGLYCLIKTEKQNVEELIGLFLTLGTVGIGSGKTVGGGSFEVNTEEVEWPVIEGDSTMLLSSYIPEEEELKGLNLESSRYQVVRRGGFMAGSSEERMRHLRKKTVYMFDVGSVFHTVQILKGKVVDITPEWNDKAMHPVYRSGKPLCVTVNDCHDEK